MSTIKSSFNTPTEVVQFIKECVIRNDPESLYSACLKETPDFWKDHIFRAFADIQQSETLESVFLENGKILAFPTDANTFKLGGHSLRTRHIHIDLVKQEGRWYLAMLSVCR